MKNKKTVMIEYLYLDLETCDRCMGTVDVLDEVVEELTPVFEKEGYKVAYKKTEIATPQMAERYRFMSSPTIRVNGQDIFEKIVETDCACCGEICGTEVECRVFEYDGSQYEIPSKEMLVNAILRSMDPSTVNCCEGHYTLPDNLRRFFEGKNKKSTVENVRKEYGKIALAKQEDSILTETISSGEMSASVGYTPEELALAPEEANMELGCGNPHRKANIQPGEVVLDLGSGAGIDCFIAGKAVGRRGRVIGVDMTPEMLSKARNIAKEHKIRNVEFRLGEIENLPVADNTADVCISNCVINMSDNKPRVYREIYRALKPGGRISICDIVIMKELTKEMQEDEAMHSC